MPEDQEKVRTFNLILFLVTKNNKKSPSGLFSPVFKSLDGQPTFLSSFGLSLSLSRKLCDRKTSRSKRSRTKTQKDKKKEEKVEKEMQTETNRKTNRYRDKSKKERIN